LNLPIERFNETVEIAKRMAQAEIDHQEECPCIDCKGEYYAAYQHCRATCPAYQRWVNA